MNGGASHRNVVLALEAAKRGVSSTLHASPRMSLADAQALALRASERDRLSARVTSYVADGVLYIGPRKQP
jgi:hypothetical protein